MKKFIPVKEGHREELKASLERAYRIARGKLGWAGHAKLMIELGLDKGCGLYRGKRPPKRRIRIKLTKRMLKQVFLADIRQHLELS